MERYLALELVSTVRHDGDGGVADDLGDPSALTAWVREHVPEHGGFTADDAALTDVLALRRAVRALFARAVAPAPPSSADARRLMPAEEALAHLNAAAARVPVVPRLVWEAQEAPAARLEPAVEPAGRAGAAARIVAELARAAVDFLAGPERERLRACTAPRCVRYFVKSHGRQEWCKPSCGNRARVARHYRRHRPHGAPS
ncbi:CGNR zinc finger domain-containing protein [Actinacidiphila glaucinigra]|uniref:CGNR zinc finger domain-containing protein n=1 Tax=Actinacidiphila glaucinigra TaxID=235986 RepID=UPI003D929AA5